MTTLSHGSGISVFELFEMQELYQYQFKTIYNNISAFFQMSQESKRRIPATVWLPWIATYSWYVMVDVYPQAFFLLQIFHALQYLMFPARVEMNEHRTTQMPMHMLIYYGILVVVGYLAFEWTTLLERIACCAAPCHWFFAPPRSAGCAAHPFAVLARIAVAPCYARRFAFPPR